MGIRDSTWPVIDLHLHLDGSISVRSARELAAIEGVKLPESDEELRGHLMVSDDCHFRLIVIHISGINLTHTAL